MYSLILSDSIRFVHLFSVAVALGVSFVADIFIISHSQKEIKSEFVKTINNYHRVILIALVPLWITGLFLVHMRTGFVLERFSPKLIGKLFIVSLLTLNAFIIGRIALPMLVNNIGNSLLSLPLWKKLRLACVAGISSASWLLALAMGLSKILAASGTAIILAVVSLSYLAAILVALALVFAIHTRFMQNQSALHSIPEPSVKSR